MVRRTLLLATAASLLAGAASAQQANQVASVIVTASPLPGDPDRFATIVEQVPRSEILSLGGASIADALRNTPGVAGTGFASGASRPVIRGMDSQRVKLVENGLSSSDVSDVGPDHGVPIDPLAAETIEVVRGAATLRYGSQAIGGVVNTFNNRVPRKLIDGVTGEATAAYSSAASTGEGSAQVEGGFGNVVFHLDGFGRRASDYDTPLGRQSNSFFRGNGYSAGASVFLNDDSRVGGAYTRYDAKYGIPAEDTYIRMKQDKGTFGSSFKMGDGVLQRINVDASYADYTHSEIDPAGPTIASTFNNREWDGRAEATFGQIGVLSGAALGLQAQDRKFDALGEGADYLLPTHTKSAAAFAFAEAPVGLFQVQGAVRAERIEISGTSAAGAATRRTFDPVSVSLGFTYDLNDAVRLGLTAASAARAPAQTELFARGPHDGPLTYETGNVGLGLERANSLEATMRAKFGEGGRLEASIWRAHFSNYIYGALSGRLCEEDGVCLAGGPGDLKELDYQQLDANFWGIEAKGSYPVASILGGELNVNILGDYVRAKFASGQGNVPRIQPGRFGGGLSWTSDYVDAGFTVLGVNNQSHTGFADATTPGYTSVDAQLAWRPAGKDGKLQLMLVGHNLADEEVRNATALNKDEVVMPGRDIRLVLTTKF